jgi:hypothetical protein
MTEIDKELQILAFPLSPEEQDRLEALVRERGGQISVAEALELMQRERDVAAMRTGTPEQPTA